MISDRSEAEAGRAFRGCALSKKKKVRVAFNKNRQKRTRANDMTRGYREDDPSTAEAASSERVRAKGDLSRHRTVMHEVARESRRRPRPDPSPRGRPLDLPARPGGPGPRPDLGRRRPRTGTEIRCNVRRILKTMAIDGRNVVAVGDRVWFRPAGSATRGLIEKVEPRSGTITRGYRRREHVIVSNVDQLLIVSALAEPGLKLPLIDRYLISAEKGGRPADHRAEQGGPRRPGSLPVGHRPLHPARLRDDRHLGRRRPGDRRGSASCLAAGTTAFSGQSGVGKSSLLNAIQPGLNLRVREVSDWTAKGKHTTTTAELIRLESGGYVVDTPGLRQFELWNVDPGEIEGSLHRVPTLHPALQVPRLLARPRIRVAVKDALYSGPDPRRTLRELSEALPGSAVRGRVSPASHTDGRYSPAMEEAVSNSIALLHADLMPNMAEVRSSQ